jgi:hypothetical protein
MKAEIDVGKKYEKISRNETEPIRPHPPKTYREPQRQNRSKRIGKKRSDPLKF